MKPSMKETVLRTAAELADKGEQVTPTSVALECGCSVSTASKHLKDWDGEGAGEDLEEDDGEAGAADAIAISRDHYVALQACAELALEAGRLRRALEAR
jgi:hypothetical protein